MTTPLKAGTETGSLFNHLFSASAGPAPEVGMGATVLLWTDRHAGTIIKVTPKSFTLREDTAIRTDNYGMSDSQAYRYEPNPNGREWVFRLTKRGWRSGGTAVMIGHRRSYHDYSF
jgi:hypothetical protein